MKRMFDHSMCRIVEDDDVGYWYKLPRSGTWWRYERPASKLAFCQRCGKLTGKRFLRQNCFYGDTRLERIYEPLFMVCIGCWSAIDSYNTKARDVVAVRRTIQKMRKELRNVENKNNGRTS